MQNPLFPLTIANSASEKHFPQTAFGQQKHLNFDGFRQREQECESAKIIYSKVFQ